MPATSIGLFIAAFLATLSLLAAAAQSDAGKTLRVVPNANLTVVDPQFIGVYITRNFGYLIYDTLFGMDRDFRPQPEMVDSWQISDDKLTYTFRLRDGLKFHDGQPVRAADAVASLKRWGQRNDSYGQPLLAAASTFELALYLPIGQLVGHRAFRNSLTGIPDSPIPVLWNIDKK
jgi:peptide/nickel transport system substrate-binding protein